jgi:hypothetical protein
MKINESAQELLELLWTNLEENAQNISLLGDALPDGADELIRLELVKQHNGDLTLTKEGYQEAARAVRRWGSVCWQTY